MSERRTVCWFSCGAASAVMTKLALMEGPVVIAYCHNDAEHDDNARFLTDCEKWWGQKAVMLRSEKYADTWAVWYGERFISGVGGAPCTGFLKAAPRLDFQRPDDIHLFGYTSDARDQARAARLRENHFDLTVRTLLIERGLDKNACRALLEGAGIAEPVTYRLGFENANCLKSGCGKATSPDYWALHRRHFPEGFAKTAALARSLGVRLCRINGERAFIDDIPADWPIKNPTSPTCDLLCGIAAADLAAE